MIGQKQPASWKCRAINKTKKAAEMWEKRADPGQERRDAKANVGWKKKSQEK